MNLGVIGFGLRSYVMIEAMKKIDDSLKIKAITDIRDLKPDLKKYKYSDEEIEKINFYSDVDDMLKSEKLDGILIGTRCSLHTAMALKVFPTGIPVFLEKPVATNIEDLQKLYAAVSEDEKLDDRVLVSFPLRFTPLVQFSKEIIDSGKIGKIEHVQAVNNVPYGRCYYHDWYRDQNETGGLFLQKATHDLDYLNYLLGYKPVKLCAMKSKQIFKGNKPAGLKCADCAEADTCNESPINVKLNTGEDNDGDYCCFAVDTGNEDSGDVLVEYDTGMHLSYSQNFFARKAAQKRGARLLGYYGTLEFDWYTSEINVYMHQTNRVENYKITPTSGHDGGDYALALNFLNLINGKEKSKATLKEGILSALMCLKAKESAETETFQDIKLK